MSQFLGRIRSTLASVFLLTLGFAAQPNLAAAQDGDYSLLTGWRPVIGVSIASKHVGADQDFEEFNPGASIGFSREMFWLGGEWGVEGGVFRNSYDERAFYVGAWTDWAIIGSPETAELRLGAFFAVAEYDQLVDNAQDAGVPTIGDFVPLVSGQASIRIQDRYALVARFGPGIDDSDFIVGFQAMYFF